MPQAARHLLCTLAQHGDYAHMTTKLLLLLIPAGKRFLHGFYLSGSFALLLLLASVSNNGELLGLVLILGAIVGLPWTVMFFPAIPLADVTNQRMYSFFKSLIPGDSEWGAIAGLAIATIFLGLHINGMLFIRSKSHNEEAG